MKKIIVVLSAILTMASCNNNPSAQQAVLDNIATRTSIRAYTSEPVPSEMVDQLLHAAMAAPSAMNRQPWRFVVLSDREMLDSLAGKLKRARMLANAPLAIIVMADTRLTLKDGSVVVNRFWVDDCSAASQNILLAAHALGLGAVWTAASDEERTAIVKETLGITDEYIRPHCIIPVGFPAESPEPKQKWDPEKVHYNKW